MTVECSITRDALNGGSLRVTSIAEVGFRNESIESCEEIYPTVLTFVVFDDAVPL
jgi:hypothetical protein